MAYKGETLKECYRKWQIDALPHINSIGRFLGICLEKSGTDWWRVWKEDSHKEGQWYRKSERDKIIFGGCLVIKGDRRSGSPRAVGELKKDHVTVGEWNNLNNDLPIENASLTWERKKTKQLVETNSKTHGWSVSTSITGTVGKDDANKLEIGVTFAANGEYSNEKAETEATEDTISQNSMFTVPPKTRLIVTQEVQSGEIEVPFTDKLSFDVLFEIIDWKKLVRSKYLRDNSDYQGYKSTKSRRWMNCRSINDLRLILSGQNNRYPNVPNVINNKKIKKHYEWLANEDNRTIIIESTARYKEGLWGIITPKYETVS